jgi:fatty-acyl-CoA synthase
VLASGRTYGEIGYLDTNGHPHLKGRRSSTIVTGGIDVYPQEDPLAMPPAVADCAVFGIECNTRLVRTSSVNQDSSLSEGIPVVPL